MSVEATGKVDRLRCPKCANFLSADDVNIALMVGLCRSCDATVELAPAGSGRAAPPDALMQLAAPPPGLTVRSEGERLIFRRSWFKLNAGTAFLFLWCVVWDGFLVFWYIASIASLLNGEVGAIVGLLFPVLHVAAGVAVTYLCAATLVNSTTVEVGPSHLTVTHGPLPWKAPAPIPLRAIDQFYLVQATQNNTRTFTLVARRSDRTSEEILSGLPDDLQPRYLERRLEAHLGLEDQAVKGEYSG